MPYDVKQFRPVLYLVVLTAITGFSMAAESQGLWAFGTTVLAVNAFLVFRGRFRPIPRFLSNLISLLAAVYPVIELRDRIGSPIIAVGEYLVILVLVKMWEQRTNRDFVSALVLSLLLMVAAAISTASLLFGTLFITFLFLALYCCLLFHLKTETEEARAVMGIPTADTAAVAGIGEPDLRQNQRHLSRSMRRLTGMVATYAIACAVAVFLFFPRGTGAGMFGQIQWKSKDTLTGFSQQVGYQDFEKISQNSAEVATVKVFRNGEEAPFSGPLYLRALTHEYYNTADAEWGPAPDGPKERSVKMINDSGTWRTAESFHDQRRRDEEGSPFKTAQMLQVDLNPTGTYALFSLPGVTAVQFEDPPALDKKTPILYDPTDTTVRVSDVLTQPVRYQVWSTGKLGKAPSPRPRMTKIDPQVTAMARRPEVSGPGLVQKREAEIAAHPGQGIFYPTRYDREIAENIAAYLRSRYKYTLDLSSLPVVKGEDPIVGFLYRFKRGHCQYFAGAMTLMCQSLGLDARLVVGFHCDDYNDFGHYYDVHQSDAHTWVEVLTADGWETYDPTSGNDFDAAAGKTAWQKAKHFFDYLEYSWQNSVISYDAENRDNLINSVDNKLNQTVVRGAGRFSGVTDAVGTVGDWVASRVVGPLVALLVTTIVGLIGWFLFERLKLRKRARRMGVDSLPPVAQAKLLRQLGFYDDLLRMLQKHQIDRPPQLTPLEFSRHLTFVPGEAFDTIGRLTRLYYKIRYGTAEIDDARQRRLVRVVNRLAEQMEPRAEYE
jgi:transglutaminase-like putative cysteine protease